MPGQGPLPNPNRRRRNAPTIPTTELPASGRPGRAPKVPTWIELGEAGRAWWRWAWRTPQAAAWASGHEVAIARRAQLEDDLAAIATVENWDAVELMVASDGTSAEFKALVAQLASLVSGRLGILREVRELDRSLGLTPKSMADLRWTIVPDKPAEQPATGVNGAQDEMSERREKRRARALTG